MAALQSQIQLADLAYQQTAKRLADEVKLHQITYDQENALLVVALNKKASLEIAALDKELALYPPGTTQYQHALSERLKMAQKYFGDLEALQRQKLEQDTKDWQSVLSPIQSAWDSQLRGLLAGTTTWAQAMKNIFADLVLDIIKKLETIGIEKLASSLAGALGGPAGLVGGLGGQSAATTANTTAVATLTAAVTANTVALGVDTASSAAKAGADAASGAGGLFSGLSGLLGLFGIPLATGAWDIRAPTAAVVHPGEMVLPQSFASGLRNAVSSSVGGGGGSASATLNLSAFNPAGLQSLIRSMMPQLAREISAFQALNPSTQ
jgi:hypothetical protein